MGSTETVRRRKRTRRPTLKLEIGLAKGKKQHDKREAEKDRDWKREQQRLMRHTR